MKMKFTRILTLILAVLMVCGMLVSCIKYKEKEEQETTAETIVTEPYVEEIKATLDLPEDLRYDGAELIMLIRHNEVDYHESDGFGGNIVKTAVYDRNQAITSRLGVTIKYENMNGYVGGGEAFQTAIRTASLSGDDGTYDAILPNSFIGAALVIEGLYVDFNELEYIDLDQPYWWSGWTEGCTINGKTYSIAGDFNMTMLGTAQVVFFNKAFMEYYNVESPYSLMDKNEWTVDKMLEISKSVTIDLNNDGKFDEIIGSIEERCQQFFNIRECFPFVFFNKRTSLVSMFLKDIRSILQKSNQIT